MARVSTLCLFGLAPLASASKQLLLVSSYKPADPNATLGAVQTLELDLAAKSGPSLTLLHTSHNCGRDPTWLDISLGEDSILCLDEAIDYGFPGHLTKLALQKDGSLEEVSSVELLRGPVHLTTYADESALAVANYEPPSISTWRVGPKDTFPNIQEIVLPIPDPRTEDSIVPHIHQAVLDPTGGYLVFPDLGSDLVRVYCIDSETSKITEEAPLKFDVGEGPRHATFWTPAHSKETFFFVIHELTSKISSYKVKYGESGLSFQKVDEVSTYGDRAPPVGGTGAELTFSPDNKFLIASNRNATVFSVPNPDPKNSTAFPSDSIATFKPNSNGKLSFVQLAPSGGKFPRHFKLNGDGTLIAVGNQNSHNVNIYTRNVKTGKIGDLVAAIGDLGPGGLTNVRWL